MHNCKRAYFWTLIIVPCTPVPRLPSPPQKKSDQYSPAYLKIALMLLIIASLNKRSFYTTQLVKNGYTLRGLARIICSEGRTIDHFTVTVVDLVPWPTSECEAEVDLVLIQTFFDLLWKLSLKNTS